VGVGGVGLVGVGSIRGPTIGIGGIGRRRAAGDGSPIGVRGET
jgi:hypothetical protein